MSASLPRPQPATYEDLRRVPAGYRVELIDGEMIVQPRPAFPHANAAGDLFADVRLHFGRGRPPGGWWILMEPELHLGSPDPRSLVLVPDVAGWRRERMQLLPAVAGCALVPDWVCEVLSPEREGYDRITKADEYARRGVPWFWIVNPQVEILEVYELRDGVYARIQAFAGGALIRARPFEEVELDTTTWWMPKPDIRP